MIQPNYLFEAANQIYPGAELSIINEKIIWIKPEKAPVSDQHLIEKAKSLANNSAYKDLRREKYPQLVEQLDMLWHDINQGKLNTESSFYKAVKAVKDQFPKP